MTCAYPRGGAADTRSPATAEQLVRSRTSACAVGDAAYLLAAEGTVEFRASRVARGAVSVQHEVSRFVRADGRWWYLDGDPG